MTISSPLSADELPDVRPAWKQINGIVKKVHSGDLVQFGDTFVARLTGIAAPSRNEGIGYEIYDFTKRELEGQLVKLFTWTTDNTAAGIVHDDKGNLRCVLMKSCPNRWSPISVVAWRYRPRAGLR